MEILTHSDCEAQMLPVLRMKVTSYYFGIQPWLHVAMGQSRVQHCASCVKLLEHTKICDHVLSERYDFQIKKLFVLYQI